MQNGRSRLGSFYRNKNPVGDRSSAVQFYNSAVSAVNDKSNPNHLQHAYSLFSSACVADPTFGQAWYQAGNNNSDLNCLPAAIANWRCALDCENTPQERAKILVNLGWRLHSLGREEEAEDVSMEALRIDPNLALAHLNLSLIYGIQGRALESVQAARRAFELDPADVHNEVVLAFALLFNGNYQEGFKHFECRFRWRLQSFLQFPYPKWEGEPGKTVYVVADQGLGDTLSFSRFIEAASKRCTFIHAQVQSELLRLFTYAFAHLPNVNLMPSPCPFPPADCWTTFVSLPYALGLTDEEIRDAPHIEYEAFYHSPNWKVADRKLHIGIAWGGSPLNDIDVHRNIPFKQFLELYQVPGIQLYSLQMDERSKELMDAGAASLVRDLKPYVRDITDTLSILPHLDLIITCESALGHICALAQKECWLPYSYQGRDYRLGVDGEKKLWTPAHRIFRQGVSQRWEPVFAKIIEALKERVK